MKKHIVYLIVCFAFTAILAQSEEAYNLNGTTAGQGLLDPSRFSLRQSMSFGMGSSNSSGLKSQSLYSTMMQYEFNAPVTLNLNFSLPIHSTFSSSQNLTSGNIQSMEYFNSIPIDVSLTWQPRDNLLMRFSVIRQPMQNSYSRYPYLLDDGSFIPPELRR